MKEKVLSWKLVRIVLFYVVVVSCVYWSWHRVPEVVRDEDDGKDRIEGLSASHAFSEERAMRHVHQLAEVIGQRQVGTYGLVRAEEYLLEESLKVKRMCKELGTCVAEVTEDTVSGAFQYNKTGEPLYLSYSGLKNILLTLYPKGSDLWGGNHSDHRALLLNAHFDSAMSSPGAADCASCVGVALESARALAASGPTGKVAFLLNGGEEIYMNAVHGFVKGHGKRYHKEGYKDAYFAFINLEATGSYGPDVVFRANSEALLRSYVRRAPRPRATVIAQDIFGSGVVPSDTDYSVLGGEQFGNLTGMDLATMFDSRSYHCARDTYDRIKRGSLQAYGDNVLEIVKDVSAGLEENDEDKVGDMVYFDILGLGVVSYSPKVTFFLHNLPLVLTAFVLDKELLFGSRNRIKFFLAVLKGILACCLSFACCLVFPAAAALLACAPSGEAAMTWYGKPGVAAVLLFPPALAGLLLPYLVLFMGGGEGGNKGSGKGLRKLSWDSFLSHCFGTLLVFSALSSYMTTNEKGIMGHSGYIFAYFSFSTLACLARSWSKQDVSLDGLALALHFLPLAASANVCMFAWLFFSDRLGLMGGGGESLLAAAKSDVTLAVITGICVLVCVGPLVPWILAAAPSRGSRARVVAGLLACSLLGWAYAYNFSGEDGGAFSREDPKRVFVVNSYELDTSLWAKIVPSGLALGLPGKGLKLRRGAGAERWTFMGADAAPLKPLVLDALGDVEEQDLIAPVPREFLLPHYPKQKRMKDVAHVVEDLQHHDALERSGIEVPKFRKTVSGLLGAGVLKGVRCEVIIDTNVPGYHTLNITGDLDRWSFTKGSLLPSQVGDTREHDSYIVHHHGHGDAGRHWRWWFHRKQRSQPALVTWSYTNLTETEAIAGMARKLPETVTGIYQTTLTHTFEC